MSRTYRRVRHPEAHTLTTWVWVSSRYGGELLQRCALEFHSEEYAREKALFHADQRPGVLNAPKWFRTVHNRAHRVRCNQALRVASADAELQFTRSPPHSNWLWF